MSDTARDLLVYGMAAAQALDKDEARFYLEWVLRTDADLEQQTEAWYWLSHVSDDPNEKRELLGNVLAVYPHHPEARRDLAILDGRLKASDVLPEWKRDVAPTAPSPEPRGAELERHVCPRCGAHASVDAHTGRMLCRFCGYTEGESNQRQGAVEEQDWIAAIYTAKGHRWELPTARTLHCENCGASFALPPSQVSGQCPFCASSYVVPIPQAANLIQPEGVLPFVLDASAAGEAIRAWMHQQRFRPADLEAGASLVPPRPTYIPAWVFRLTGQVHWSGTIIEESYGRKVPVRTEGMVPVFPDDVAVPGSPEITVEEFARLQFNTGEAMPYSADFLADWPAQIYTRSLSDAAVLAHAEAVRATEGTVKSSVMSLSTGEDVKIMRSEIAMLSYKLLLVPVWFAHYTYRDRLFRVLVNGHSGHVQGDVPRGRLSRFASEVLGEH